MGKCCALLPHSAFLCYMHIPLASNVCLYQRSCCLLKTTALLNRCDLSPPILLFPSFAVLMRRYHLHDNMTRRHRQTCLSPFITISSTVSSAMSTLWAFLPWSKV